ncbi:ABC transporter permease [Micromonospora globbae]|uniref:ABC transporter permease n=1 Tax=Micromonospora globbae TaxID=1894969 RepID=A0ABZ1SD81_9ACTN|nr:ABC transporter permease [Micromonospora globbae]
MTTQTVAPASRKEPETPTPQRRRSLVPDLHERPEIALVPIVFVVVMTAWEFIPGWLGVDDFVLPTPSQIFQVFVDQLGQAAFWHNFWVTLQEAGAGFVLATVLAVLIGTFVAQITVVERTVLPYIVAFQSVPKVALAPMFVVWFGFGMTSKIVMATIIAFFPILINVIAGLKSADNDKIEMLTSFGATRFQVFRMVRFPSALPYIFAGLQSGVVFAILGAIVGEYIGAQEGLGYQLMQANYRFDIQAMFAVLIVLSIMGMIAHGVVKVCQRRFVFWSGDQSKRGT